MLYQSSWFFISNSFTTLWMNCCRLIDSFQNPKGFATGRVSVTPIWSVKYRFDPNLENRIEWIEEMCNLNITIPNDSFMVYSLFFVIHGYSNLPRFASYLNFIIWILPNTLRIWYNVTYLFHFKFRSGLIERFVNGYRKCLRMGLEHIKSSKFNVL